MGSHSTFDPRNKMVAAQVMKCLWAASLAVAAPQLDFGDTRSAGPGFLTTNTVSNNINQDQVVTDVVYALQPSIEQAVRDALRGLRSSTSMSSSSSATGFASGSSSKSGSNSADISTPAEYNFEYKVADEEQQTYISQQEARNGDQLTGSYSYVDPTGALVTVNYEAGAMGFSATTDKQDGFLTIRTNNNNRVSSSSGSQSSSSFNSDALIAQVLAALQPQINSAVQTAISTSSSARSFAESPRISSASSRSSGGNVEGTFGSGISVSIDTPEYNIAY